MCMKPWVPPPAVQKLSMACRPTVLVLWKWKQEDHLWLLSKSWDTWDLVSTCICKMAGPENKGRASAAPRPPKCLEFPNQNSGTNEDKFMRTKGHHFSRSLTVAANKLDKTGRASSRFSLTDTWA